MFRDRKEAGERLAEQLTHLRDRKPVVLALPRGGVAVGLAVARRLDAPLDLVLVRKIGVPWQPELALGAVTDGPSPDVFIDRRLADA
jgi:predicted phosphoribosyltransferase